MFVCSVFVFLCLFAKRTNLSYGRFVFFLFVGGLPAAYCQQSKADSLRLRLKKTLHDTDRVNTLNALSKQLWQGGRNYDTAFIYAENAKRIAQKINFKKGIANSYNNIGLVYYRQGNYPESLKNYFASLKIREALVPSGSKGTPEVQKDIAASYNNIGNVYFSQGNYPDALKNHFASLKIREEIGDKQGIAASYNNIGTVYHSQGNYPDALKNYFASLKIREEIGDKLGIATSYNNIGNIYALQGNYSEALKNYYAALKIREEIGDKNGIASSYNNIGNAYVKLGKNKEAQEYLHKALELSKEIGSKDDIKESYEGLAKADSAQADSPLTPLQKRGELWESAYGNYKMYILYRDSLINEENTKKTVQLQMTYEFEKKEAKAKAEQEKKDAVQKAEARRQKIVFILTSGFLILVLVFTGFIARAYLQIKKKNKEIALQKQKIEEKQNEILASIRYAKRIQDALLPRESYIDKTLKRLMKK